MTTADCGKRSGVFRKLGRGAGKLALFV